MLLKPIWTNHQKLLIQKNDHLSNQVYNNPAVYEAELL